MPRNIRWLIFALCSFQISCSKSQVESTIIFDNKPFDVFRVQKQYEKISFSKFIYVESKKTNEFKFGCLVSVEGGSFGFDPLLFCNSIRGMPPYSLLPEKGSPYVTFVDSTNLVLPIMRIGYATFEKDSKEVAYSYCISESREWFFRRKESQPWKRGSVIGLSDEVQVKDSPGWKYVYIGRIKFLDPPEFGIQNVVESISFH